MASWKTLPLPGGSKLFKNHHFTFMFGGSTYHLEIDEYADGVFAGHGQHSTDESHVIASVSASSLEHCLEQLIGKVTGKKAS